MSGEQFTRDTVVRTLRDRDDWLKRILAIRERKKFTAVDKVICTCLGLHFNVKTGQCNPAIATIAAECGLGQATIYRRMKQIRNLGHIAWDGKKGGPANSYSLNFVATETLSHGDRVSKSRNPLKSAPEPSQIDTPNPLTGENPYRTEKENRGNREERVSPEISPADKKPAPAKKQERLSANELSTLFDNFWHAFPRRVAKEAARRVYSKIIITGRATAAELLQGAFRYKAERAGQDPRYTKHPATWLNGGCWQDEAAPAGTVIDQAGNPVEPPRPAAPAGPLTHTERQLRIIAGRKP
jgi:hypothetical protein